MSNSLFQKKIVHLWDNVEQYGRARQATAENIVERMRFASWITKARRYVHARTDRHTHTHIYIYIYILTNTHCFSTATTVTRTRLYVTIYVSCLSCSIRSSSFLCLLFNLHSPPSYEFMLWEWYAHSEQQSHYIYLPAFNPLVNFELSTTVWSSGERLHTIKGRATVTDGLTF
jgi:hypothetical protein